jgi:type IV pilus assembly protein PilV
MEVLVALLVLAIGLLGLAALQTQGLRFNQDAYVRSQATLLAYDIMDTMRARRDQVADFEQVPADPGLACDPADSSVNMALSCWFDALGDALPGATASIAQQAAPNDSYWDLTLRWVDREPRAFGGVRRLPQTQAECEALIPRVWDATQGTCMLVQTWTFWP